METDIMHVDTHLFSSCLGIPKTQTHALVEESHPIVSHSVSQW